jgi:undecaprenyl pyrophosphate synthase
MGNSGTISDSVKAQASAGGLSVYKLVNMAGEGELVHLMKKALQTKSFKEIDEFIQKEIPPYLYNEGQGEMVITK